MDLTFFNNQFLNVLYTGKIVFMQYPLFIQVEIIAKNIKGVQELLEMKMKYIKVLQIGGI